MKKVFYHFKNEAHRETLDYCTGDSVAKIKETISGNGAVLDAIYHIESNKLTVYSKRYGKQAYLDVIAE